MTREQHIARELISLYEGGSRLTCEEVNGVLRIETDTGATWTVDREAKNLRCSALKFTMDLCELETRIDNPDLFAPDNRELFEPDPYSPENPPAPIRVATDEDRERAESLRSEAIRIERDRQFYRDQERGAA